MIEFGRDASSIAAEYGNFSNLVQQFPLGSKASNIEIAIAGYEAVLTVYTREAFPQNYAETLLNLGWLYQEERQIEKAYDIFSEHCNLVLNILNYCVI